MPLVLAPADYARWLGEEPDPRDLMRPFPSELMHVADLNASRQAGE
jgi:putative SOS response-associated peptidase YedK